MSLPYASLYTRRYTLLHTFLSTCRYYAHVYTHVSTRMSARMSTYTFPRICLHSCLYRCSHENQFLYTHMSTRMPIVPARQDHGQQPCAWHVVVTEPLPCEMCCCPSAAPQRPVDTRSCTTECSWILQRQQSPPVEFQRSHVNLPCQSFSGGHAFHPRALKGLPRVPVRPDSLMDERASH